MDSLPIYHYHCHFYRKCRDIKIHSHHEIIIVIAREQNIYVIVAARWFGEAFCDGVLSDFGDSLLTLDVGLAFVTVTDVRFTTLRLLVGGGYS